MKIDFYMALIHRRVQFKDKVDKPKKLKNISPGNMVGRRWELSANANANFDHLINICVVVGLCKWCNSVNNFYIIYF